MPIILEQINQPNPADHADMVKIYQDDPALYGQMIEPWLSQSFSTAQLFFGGRFNGRLLAGLWVEVQANDWHIHHLCVRTITRRRGVARQLLQLLCKEASKQGTRLHFANTDPEILHPLLTSSGFNQQGEQWLFDGNKPA